MLGILKRKYKPKDAFGRPYPLEHVKSSVGRGWGPIVERLYNLCVEYKIDIHQVKEKFGGLRFYTGGVNQEYATEFFNQVQVAEEESFRTCENCGNPGKPRTGGWIKTLCNDCNQHGKVELGYSHELEHLLSPSALEDWKRRVKSGEVSRTIRKFINDLTEALNNE